MQIDLYGRFAEFPMTYDKFPMMYIGQLKSIHKCACSVVTIKKWSLFNGLKLGQLDCPLVLHTTLAEPLSTHKYRDEWVNQGSLTMWM